MNELLLFFAGILTLVATIGVIYMAATVPDRLRRLLNELSEGAKRVDRLSAQLNLLSQQLEMMDKNLDQIRAQVVEIKLPQRKRTPTSSLHRKNNALFSRPCVSLL